MSFAKLTADTIVDEAIALMRAEGLDRVTLRSVAARLNARAPSLYRHIADKDALHALMSERIFRECLEAVPPCTGWPQWLRAFGRALWAAQSGDAGVLRLIQVRAQEDRVTIDLRERVVGTLVALGMDRAKASLAQRSVQALVTGWTTLRRPSDPQAGDAALFAAIDALVNGWGGGATAD